MSIEALSFQQSEEWVRLKYATETKEAALASARAAFVLGIKNHIYALYHDYLKEKDRTGFQLFEPESSLYESDDHFDGWAIDAEFSEADGSLPAETSAVIITLYDDLKDFEANITDALFHVSSLRLYVQASVNKEGHVVVSVH